MKSENEIESENEIGIEVEIENGSKMMMIAALK